VNEAKPQMHQNASAFSFMKCKIEIILDIQLCFRRFPMALAVSGD